LLPSILSPQEQICLPSQGHILRSSSKQILSLPSGDEPSSSPTSFQALFSSMVPLSFWRPATSLSNIPLWKTSYWEHTFRSWPNETLGWRNWYFRMLASKRARWDDYDIGQCINLSLSNMTMNESMLIAASHFWSDALNVFLFGHGPMTPTLVDVLMPPSLFPILWVKFLQRKNYIKNKLNLGQNTKFFGNKASNKTLTQNFEEKLNWKILTMKTFGRKKLRKKENKTKKKRKWGKDIWKNLSTAP